MRSIIRLPARVQRRLEAAALAILRPEHGTVVDFSRPAGQPALVPPDSVSWRIFKSPVALFVGGVAAVIQELAEPSVRAGVWEHSNFPQNPVGRLQRTGLAAMVTVYGARSVAETMIRAVGRRHGQITGMTADGVAYSASDPVLLTWVQATAAFSFANAYDRYVEALTPVQFDALYREAVPAANLYGAVGAPRSAADMRTLFDSMRGRLTPSPVIFEFLRLMRESAAFPPALRWLQPLLVRAAVEIVPNWIRAHIDIDSGFGLRARERWLVRLVGNLSNRIVLTDGPAAQSCRRLGLPVSYLYA